MCLCCAVDVALQLFECCGEPQSFSPSHCLLALEFVSSSEETLLFCCARCTSRVGQGRHHGREVARFTWLHKKPPTRDETRLLVTFLSLRHCRLQAQRRFLLCMPATPWFVLPQAVGSSLYSWIPTVGLQCAAALLV